MAREVAALVGVLLVLFAHRSSESSTTESTSLSPSTASSMATPTLSVPAPSSSTSTHSTPSQPTSTHSTPSQPTSTPTPSTPVPSPPTSTHSTAARSHRPQVTPVPTSGQPVTNMYILNSTDVSSGKMRVCLLMVASMAVQFEYPTSGGEWASATVPVGADASINLNKSHCQLTVCAEPTSATLVIENQGLTLALSFDELENNKHWSYNSTRVNYTVTDSLFPNFAHKDLLNKPISAYSTDSLFDWSVPHLSIPSSYLCEANSSLGHFNSSEDAIKVSVSFSHLQVQAFKFTSDQQFDKTESCYADRDVVVPVAVGGALGALACTVLIAALIRMCWNKCKGRRKPPHYHHLSSNVD